MNDCGISFQRHSRIRRGDIIFNKLLASLLDSMYIEYDTNILFELAIGTSTGIQII